jgi:hypothetical protein
MYLVSQVLSRDQLVVNWITKIPVERTKPRMKRFTTLDITLSEKMRKSPSLISTILKILIVTSKTVKLSLDFSRHGLCKKLKKRSNKTHAVKLLAVSVLIQLRDNSPDWKRWSQLLKLKGQIAEPRRKKLV